MPPAAVIRSDRDVYANLLRDTRGLRREQASLRESWFAALPWERKEETLFDLEMLLKGIACFGNPRNHPGAPIAKTAVAQDFHEELRVLREGIQRVVALTKSMLGEKERAYTFTRYLESVLLEDSARGRLVQEQLSQDTPEESLLVLRNSMAHYVDVCDGLLRTGRISNRLYFATQGLLIREIGRSAFFNPLVALEFRPEFDRIRTPEVLEALTLVESDVGHRVLAMTFLALFRFLRYVALVDRYAADPTMTRHAFLVLAVLRSDVRALTRYLSRRSGDVIAEGLEKEILQIPMHDIRNAFDAYAKACVHLTRIRTTLENLGNSLRVEVKKTFEHDIPSLRDAIPNDRLAPQLVVAAAQLRASFQHAIRALCVEIRPGSKAPEFALDVAGRRVASDRLRREIWMFQQILRAFLAKAEVARTTAIDAHDRWAGQASFQFVRDFLGHFRAIGYQLVRTHDYDRLDPFLAALDRLRDVDLLDPERMEEAVAECREFAAFLGELVESVSSRAELKGIPLDRHGATETLKIYLGRS